MILVYWLVTSAALVATTVKALSPSASGTSKKANRPLGFDVVTAPVGCRVTVTFGSVWPTRVTVASVVMPSPTGGGVRVDVEVEDRLRGRRGGAAAVVAWKP